MKKCPDESELAAFVLGQGAAADRRAILSHIRGCTKCHKKLQEYERLRSVLDHCSLAEEGKLMLNPPIPRQEFVDELKRAAARRFSERRARRKRLSELVNKLVSSLELFRPTQTPLMGYAATAPGGRKGRLQTPAEASLRVELEELLEMLLDPNVPRDLRAEWVRSARKALAGKVKRFRTGEPGQ